MADSGRKKVTDVVEKRDEKIQKLGPEKIEATREVLASLKNALGTKSDELTIHLLNQLIGFLPPNLSEYGIKPVPLATALFQTIKPKDELEALLASQMVATHTLAMKFLNRANREDATTEQITNNVERSNKLLRTFTAQIEALNRYRSKGQQKVVVEHVHVHQGGQAVIGVVEPRRVGGEHGRS